MKLTAQLRLLPTPAQAEALKRTLETTNAACNAISAVAWATGTFGKYALQKLCYQDVRDTFGLSAQMVVRALAKVGDAYKLSKLTRRTFRPLASIAYDDRILSCRARDKPRPLGVRSMTRIRCYTRMRAAPIRGDTTSAGQ